MSVSCKFQNNIFVTVFLFLILSLNSYSDIQSRIDSDIELSVADLIDIPTESILILNEITSNETLIIEEHSLQRIKSAINIEHATDVFTSIPVLLTQRNILNISSNDILPVLSSFIRYHNDIFGEISDNVYYELAKSIKYGENSDAELILYSMFHEWLLNSEQENRIEIANFIASILPLTKISTTMDILSSLNQVIEQKQLFAIMDKIENDHPNNLELIKYMKHLKNNILHPEKIKKWHVIY